MPIQVDIFLRMHRLPGVLKTTANVGVLSRASGGPAARAPRGKRS